ncbi:aldo/keto reductase [Tautonia plasticadhaerens]|uniref:2,5-diketo-D-gluconic acid reductase B n=1 Tax=Tautonia plasticadhaerens TaxID=2527974 RepID=A0A518GZ67_9BACT|nr:aldo/keto reductase [Tautonia plasticadhaerens]QDV33822.1 2,5-diketo-D-gluconic acid reductase B [Tautonia plasticadhaerens]
MTPRPQDLSRRDFVRSSAALAAAAATARGSAVRADEGDPIRVPSTTLGRTGAEVSRLGIGCAYFQREHVTPDDVQATLRRALELGVTYLDVAPNYGNEQTGFSEEKMGPSLEDADFRSKFFLVTKTEEPTRDGTWRLLEQSLRRMRTDSVDLVHLHNFGDEPRWGDPKFALGKDGSLGALREAREQGLVRFIGASGHLHPSRFHLVLDSGAVDVLMNAVNFVVQHSYDFEHKVWSRARQDNVGLVAMKVLGGAGDQSKATGGGHRLPEGTYEQAMRYAFTIPGLHVAVIGMEGIPELEQAAKTVATIEPLSDAEALELARTGLDMAAREDWAEAYGTPVI